MSGEVQLKTIADYQAAIQKLDRKNPEDMKKIQEYNAKIGEILSGASKDGKIDSGNNDLFIRTTEDSVTVKAKNQVPDQEDIDGMKELRNKQNVADEFATDENGEKISDAQLKGLKDEYKAAKKAFKDAQKAAGKIKFDKANPNEYARLQREAQQKVADAQARLTEAETKYEKAKAAHDAEGGRANRGIRKAAKHNEKNYTNVNNREQVYLTKDEEKAAIAKEPNLKGHTKVLSEDNMKTLMAMDSYARAQIKEAEAHQRFDDWTKMFGADGKGEVDYSKIDTRAAQKALMGITGDDANGNLDEVQVAAKQLGVSKGDVKGTLKAFGFGTESALGQKLKNAGIAAAAVGLTSFIGKSHSHKTAEASATATGETVQGEVNWLASNGEEFYKFYEAKGGEAAVSVVAEACAKIPTIGKIAAPVVAGVTAFLLTKGKTEDALNGANVEAAMKDLSLVKGKDNKAIVNKIQDMTLTGNKGIDDAIKASIIKASIGEDTKSANTEELLAAYKNIQKAKEVIGKIEEQKPEVEEHHEEEQVQEEPVQEDPCTDIEERSSHCKPIPSVQVKGHGQSPYWIAQAYVMPDGSELTPNQRREVQKLLANEENKQVQERGNFEGSKIGYSYRNEITLSDGTVVKLADDAAKRIGTGKTTKTRVVIKNGKKFTEEREVDCKTRQPVEGPNGQWHRVDS